MLVHSIDHARACRDITRIIVSTDSPAYADIARMHGAEVPFLRPAEISGDLSSDLEVFTHALNWLRKEEGELPDLIVHVRPTYPTRRPSDISTAIRLLLDHPDWDSVRSVAPALETPFKMWFLRDDGTLQPVVPTTIRDAHNAARQSLPPCWTQNACIDVTRPETILTMKSMTGNRIGAFPMDHLFDIDSLAQMDAAEREARREGRLPRGKIFCVDIDGVIASLTPGNDYRRAEPLTDNIARINRLHAAGNRIVLFTARGSTTGLDWRVETEAQLQRWGVAHDELHLGKPAADYYVDDRALGLGDLALWLDGIPPPPPHESPNPAHTETI